MSKKLSILLIYVAICATTTISIWAQQPTYHHYTSAEGLPSMQVYNIIQDSQGFVWMATAMGITRFDGKHFATYTTAEGLPENDVWDIREDTIRHTLWLLTAGGYTCYLKNNQFHQGKTNIFGNLTTAAICKSRDIVIDYKSSLLLYGDSLEQTILPNQKQYFHQAISCTFPENKQNIWLGTWGGGAFHCVDYQTDSLKVQNYLPNKTITSILQDIEGNYWFSTLGEGVFLLTHPYVITYTKVHGLINEELYTLKQDTQQNIWMGSSRGTLSKLTLENSIYNFDIDFSINAYNRVNDLWIDAQQNKWAATDEGLMLLDNSGQRFLVEVGAIKSVFGKTNEHIWVGNYHFPALLDTYQGLPIDTLNLQQVHTFCQDAEEKLWIGTAKGLYHYWQDTLFFWGNRHELLNKSITDLAFDQQNRLWIATSSAGLLIKQADVILHINTTNGLCSNTIHAIFVDETQTAWLATNKGLAKIILDNLNPKTLKISYFSRLDGLASNHVNDVLVNDSKVWVATINGLSVFDKTVQKRLIPPKIYINNVQIWQRDTSVLAKYDLPHDQNNIKIDYTGLSYQSAGQLRYWYKMEGLDATWLSTDLPTVQYPALPSGNYVFRVLAVDKNGTKSKHTANIRFHIRLPFWKRWWFVGLLAMISCFVLSGIIYAYLLYFKEKSEWKNRIISSQQMALRAQMNPHFIFNSLNSIQYFITTNNKKAANIYLSTFSELIRRVLNNSQKSSISLEEEIEYLDLYLQIESLRFKDKFSYQINTNPTLELDELRIPPMLIQPYVENALQHGLLPKQSDDRKLKIQFTQKGEMELHCIITDNGIGRKQAATLQKNRPLSVYKSIGTSNPKERLAILNQLHEGHISVYIKDLYNAQNQAIGTKVLIKLPTYLHP